MIISEASREDVLEVAKTVWHLMSEDGAKLENFNPVNRHNDGWIKAEIDGVLVGVCRCEQRNTLTVEIHPYMHAKHKRHSFRFGRAVIDWLGNKGIKKIIGFIGVCHSPVYRVSKKIGFKDEGLLKSSYLKNGRLNDQWVVGLSL